MFRQLSSFAVSGIRNVSTSATVANVLSNHIQDLSKKSDHILQMKSALRRVKPLNVMQDELLQSEPRVVHQLHFLKKLYNECVTAAGQLHTDDAPITKTPSNAPLSVISERLQDLHRKLAIISEVEDQLYCQAMSIDEDRTHVITSKSSVVHQFNMLKQIFEEIAWEIELHSQGGRNFDKLKTFVMLKSKELPEVVNCDWAFEDIQGPVDKHRYLLVSNGCEIHCLDLKRSTQQSVTCEVPFLPVIATLNLQHENLPTAVGLFKWRSSVYMIGGPKLPQVLEEEYPGIELYRALCKSEKVKPTSRLIHGLSLDNCKTSLSYSESNIFELKKPKIWPIVEEIKRKIHVIDCLPSELLSDKCVEWTGSHEVLSHHNGCRVEQVPTPVDSSFHILSHVVVNDKIYARSTEGFLVFDSRMKKWQLNSRTQEEGNCVDGWECGKLWRRPLFKDIWDILDKIRVVNCVGGFPYGYVNDPLYVVIALEESDATSYRTHVVAFLINCSGRILCIQPLKHFFKGSFCCMVHGKIIKVEEDKKGKKKTMCSVVIGSDLEWYEGDTVMNKLLINTFSVEELPGVTDKVRNVAGKGSKALPVEMEFVRVEVMDRYVYKTDEELHGADSRQWANVQACFL